jgi:hypothetical protein
MKFSPYDPSLSSGPPRFEERTVELTTLVPLLRELALEDQSSIEPGQARLTGRPLNTLIRLAALYGSQVRRRIVGDLGPETLELEEQGGKHRRHAVEKQ